MTEGSDAVFTVSASPAPANDLEVVVFVDDHAASDFVDSAWHGAHTVTVAAGDTSVEFRVPTVDDADDEPDGDVTVEILARLDDYTRLGSISADVVVNDNDEPSVTIPPSVTSSPSVTISGGAAVTEGEEAVFTVTAEPAPSADLTVDVTVADAAGSDFVAAGEEGRKTVTIEAGRTTATLRVPTVADGADESDGDITVTLENGSGYALGAATAASVTVRDDDTPPSVTTSVTISGGAAVTEGEAAVFTVTAAPAPSADLTVDVTVADAAGSDFVAAGEEGRKTVTVEAGQTTATLRVPTVADGADEPDGDVTVTLEDGSGYAQGVPASASVTARDDDAAPTVAIGSDAVAPVHGPFSITIVFSAPVTGFDLGDLVVGNGAASALAGEDATYAATITPEASGRVTVDIPDGAAQDGAGNPSTAADQFAIVAEPIPVPALPATGSIVLALLLAAARRRAAR